MGEKEKKTHKTRFSILPRNKPDSLIFFLPRLGRKHLLSSSASVTLSKKPPGEQERGKEVFVQIYR